MIRCYPALPEAPGDTVLSLHKLKPTLDIRSDCKPVLEMLTKIDNDGEENNETLGEDQQAQVEDQAGVEETIEGENQGTVEETPGEEQEPPIEGENTNQNQSSELCYLP